MDEEVECKILLLYVRRIEMYLNVKGCMVKKYGKNGLGNKLMGVKNFEIQQLRKTMEMTWQKMAKH